MGLLMSKARGSTALESDVQIYTVGILNPPRDRKAVEMAPERNGLALLEELSRATGGLFFHVNAMTGVAQVADRRGAAQCVRDRLPPVGDRRRPVPHVRLAARPGYYAAESRSLPEGRVMRP